MRCRAVRLVGSPWGKAVPVSPRVALPRQGAPGLQLHRFNSSTAPWAPHCQHPWGGDRGPCSPPARSPQWALLGPTRLLEVGSEWGDQASTANGISSDNTTISWVTSPSQLGWGHRHGAPKNRTVEIGTASRATLRLQEYSKQANPHQNKSRLEG